MDTVSSVQEWEGRVVEITDKGFTAWLVDLTAKHSHESEEATISFAEISQRDAAVITEGSIFRWMIGYVSSDNGSRKRVSRIAFRDPHIMTESDLRYGKMWAEKTAHAFNAAL